MSPGFLSKPAKNSLDLVQYLEDLLQCARGQVPRAARGLVAYMQRHFVLFGKRLAKL